jgi:hypothetical protein
MISNLQLQHTWWFYASVAVGYTALVHFMWPDPIFSSKNAKPLWSIVWAHSLFLIFILELTWLAISTYPSLPDWVTRSHSKGSFFVLICIGIALASATIERRKIYVESETENSEPEDNPS